MKKEELRKLAKEEKQKIVKEINTELASIATEEKRTGVNVVMPNAEQLTANMAQELLRCKHLINMLLPKMTKKSIQRATLAYLDLPAEGLPVYLKTEHEKTLFALGQRAIMARTVIIQHHTNKLVLEARQQKQQAEEALNVPAT